jgi:plastocyanin
MNTPFAMTGAAAREPQPVLARWTVGTLLVGTLLLVYMQVFLVRAFMPPIALIFGVPALIFAALTVAIRRRWSPLLGALYWFLFLGANGPYLAHDVRHPEFFSNFTFTVMVLATAVVGLAAGIGAALQNYRPAGTAGAEAHRQSAPRWFPLGLATLVGLGLGAALVAALPQGGAAAGVSADTLAALPALITAQHQFDQTELRAKAGESVALRLENEDASGHTFDIDELDLHVSMPPGQPALALFTASAPGTYTFYCAVPGHREAGMVGTLIIEP